MKNGYGLLILFISVATLFCGCGRYKEYNLKPDDELSRAVSEALGQDLHYHGKEDTDIYGTSYQYQIKNKNAETISRFVDVINASMSGEQRKISVYVFADIPGGVECVFCLFNYSDSSLKSADIIDGCYLYINRPRAAEDSIYFNPVTYTSIKGIKKLSIPNEMDKKAKTEGIDWYAKWPDLEEVIVRE